MKVLFYEPYALWTHHIATCLEIVQGHLDQGDDVTFLGCEASLPACDPNRTHNLDLCLSCTGKRRKGLTLLSGEIKYENFVRLCQEDKRKISCLSSDFKDLGDLKQYRIGNFDIGYAVVSSFLHRTEDAERNMPDFDKNRHIILRMMKAAYKVYLSLLNRLAEETFDRVYIFNGRFAPIRGVLRACQGKGVNCYIHERGANINKYMIYKNALPHDIKNTEAIIRETWLNSTDRDKERIASDFYQARAKGQGQSWYSFTRHQKSGMLPDNWDASKENIVIFNSSEFEYSAIGDEWRNPLYESQVEGIRQIVASMTPHSAKFHVYLRIHPNLSGVTDSSVSDIYKIVSDNFTIIPAESEISTYSLVYAADKIVTFGSTVGIEAAFWGKPSLLAGMCFYRNLESIYVPASHQELIKMLLSELLPQNKTGSLMYGYYLNTFGIPYRYFEADGIFGGTFKKVRLDAEYSAAIRILLVIGSTRLGGVLKQFFSKIHADWLL